MADYARIVQLMKARHGVRVRRWRRQMSGCAWRATYADGSGVNWIESPVPKTPISLAIFLHEVGHHAVGFDRYTRRCEEEYHVWQWAMSQMKECGVNPDARVLKRYQLSMNYALDKAIRRGMKTPPTSLAQFMRRP